jgi:hypothetical protein
MTWLTVLILFMMIYGLITVFVQSVNGDIVKVSCLFIQISIMSVFSHQNNASTCSFARICKRRVEAHVKNGIMHVQETASVDAYRMYRVSQILRLQYLNSISNS